jgi:hypothetical protein
MLNTLSWSAFRTLLLLLAAGYYVLVLVRYYGLKNRSGPAADRSGPPLPPGSPPAPHMGDAWMDGVLSALEETVLHAQKKRYHPEELIQAVQAKLREFKQNP